MAGVTFRDETATGRAVAAWEVGGLPDRMTVRELIRLRVREEVTRYNSRPANRFAGLVRPEGATTEPGGYRLAVPRPLDWERQAVAAERAFRSNGFFVLAGDRQVEDLDEEVDLTACPGLVFIKLIPLVGG
ncbi:hypothetical protein OIB37_23660 [Streptomyces sp. NBC_00820]|uniref:hypothetical protein n=1 Tax=Streptomyces sp. NBC_00820 TaxID=2975842 RepID=UPI002ED3347C|nr:hypothetical protein OIB37_23660 [Streptomyces sp. NBC_00820]